MKHVCVLGATGSIGCSTLDVISRHPQQYAIHSLAAHTNVDTLFEQCVAFKPQIAVLVSRQHALQLSDKLAEADLDIEVRHGEQALIDIARDQQVDIVMAAIVGASGLLPTMAAVEAGKKVLLANKESLVTSGQLFIDALATSEAELIPIDSEHNAIYQCLPHTQQDKTGHCTLKQQGISKLILTGSGGPFRTTDLSTFDDITPEQAIAHPNWDMGKKISVDSATMMNKGLEFIEAKWLFNVEPNDIQVLLHPQSTIHSMVQYADGSVLAQMGNPDMRTPIAHALAFPERIDAGVEPLDFLTVKDFTFEAPDFERYPNLKLAIEACGLGQAACTALNAANEVAVDAFLRHRIKFTDIAKVNELTMREFVSYSITQIEDVLSVDKDARQHATTVVESLTVSLEQTQ
ncbi:1-deoxy-D-xylulose-5-phosphate reductoisomerase [Thalassotalea agarivorans]|uniref:1-deoxy-D-xylulose 5-phosphate reductoisomerase n=1 Tax=Thalassotalea agarivorans TaxID=349064 RepID=A0A1H9ZSV2_THASX|nr:1-deoxy-D-xylulose-5-phosphate reductoisomerase [Thalassotalea agarivorans]SES84752.1 1-deoxy-D-xylulose 5-phosphate reductoisomerase [Thalassotalea agarivorans]